MRQVSEYNRVSANSFFYMESIDAYGTSSDAANRLSDLYADYIHHRPNSAGWEFRAEVIKLAKSMLGNFPEWYTHQTNMNMGEYHFKLIEETVRFVSTGRRNMCVHTLAELISGSDLSTKRVAKIPGTFDPMVMMGVKGTPELIAKWCQQPNGFIDMLCTLYLLFGHSRENYAQGY